MALRKETVGAVKSGRPGFSPGCNPSNKVDFSNFTSLSVASYAVKWAP